jgi:hypothetical protein
LPGILGEGISVADEDAFSRSSTDESSGEHSPLEAAWRLDHGWVGCDGEYCHGRGARCLSDRMLQTH